MAVTTAAGIRASSALAAARLTGGRWLATMAVLSAVCLLTLLTCLQFGVERIGLADMVTILARALRPSETTGDAIPAQVILLQIRLPRILLGFLVGGCLAAVGVGLQAFLRNPLADPYVLGVSSGAALGAAVAILLKLDALAPGLVPASAFTGSLLSLLALYRIAASYGHLPVHTLLLGGVIINALCSALIMFVTSLVDPAQAFRIIAWLMGALSSPDYATLGGLAAYLAIGGALLFRQAFALNVLTLGEDSARSLGVEVERVKRILFFVTALLSGAVVTASGLIGFVGMVVPHAVRMVVGADHRLLMPASALAGGALLAAADTVARMILAPAELPVGVVTALIGAPFFLYLLMARKGDAA